MAKDINKKMTIINTAEKLFYSIGVSETTMDKLAKESGFTKRTLYSYFSSKEDIFYEVLLKSFSMLNLFVKKRLEECSDVNGFDKIKILGNCLIEFNKTNPQSFKAISDFQNIDIEKILENKTAIKCYEEGQYLVEIMQDCLNYGVDNKQFKDNIDIKKTFILLWAFISGMINLINYKSEYIEKYLHENIDEVLNYSYDLLFSSLKN
ncbi:TetR/AcrR family transcriptional regulator [uncultured Clostridium sp.]|uniref:TetR/AcrR family transcriptional regulator n=1 Tax=uncultured Clostridium sp. TaxID=59620 RepID=UPI0025F3DC2A|nr:TetR/AcrR family transcriptional regulator [uncultured Clostridium sp.]